MAQEPRRLNVLASTSSPLILGGLTTLTTFQKLALIFHTDGGGDLLDDDIPKGMMPIADRILTPLVLRRLHIRPFC